MDASTLPSCCMHRALLKDFPVLTEEDVEVGVRGCLQAAVSAFFGLESKSETQVGMCMKGGILQMPCGGVHAGSAAPESWRGL